MVFEELIRKFAELSNETAGEHFTPREVIKLMVNLLFLGDDAQLVKPGAVHQLPLATPGSRVQLVVSERASQNAAIDPKGCAGSGGSQRAGHVGD